MRLLGPNQPDEIQHAVQRGVQQGNLRPGEPSGVEVLARTARHAYDLGPAAGLEHGDFVMAFSLPQ